MDEASDLLCALIKVMRLASPYFAGFSRSLEMQLEVDL